MRVVYTGKRKVSRGKNKLEQGNSLDFGTMNLWYWRCWLRRLQMMHLPADVDRSVLEWFPNLGM